MNTLGFDFKDTWLPLRNLSFALRLGTQENLYAPDPAFMVVREDADSIRMEASRLIWAGGQQTAPGGMSLQVCRGDQGIFSITGYAWHDAEIGRSLVLLVRGLAVSRLIGESDNMPAAVLPAGKHTESLTWPGRTATMPLVFIDCGEQPEAFALSRDDKVRRKGFSAHYDYLLKEPVLVLSHQEDTRLTGNRLELPAWELGQGIPRSDVLGRRFSDLERCFGMKPFGQHPERQWVNDLKLVVNLHGMHWTGHVFLTFAQQAHALRMICRNIPGRQVLAFLPAWEGSYYRQSPPRAPAPELGGEEGLKALVDTAHSLGVRVIPMLDGPNLADERFLRDNGLMDARLKSDCGQEKVQNWVDWNSDLFYEKMGWQVNFGHPGFRRHHAEICCQLLERYGFDGVFLDGSIRWENCPDFSPYEGLKAWGEAIHHRFPNALLMGEDGYDLLWDIFGLFATYMQPLGLEQAMLRYTRQSWYLAFPAPGGSGGVHEQAWYSSTANGKMKQFIIPTLSIVGDTLTDHADKLDAAVKQARDWVPGG